MIMVPESEYLALLGMIKGNDFLQNEKAQADSEIKRTLDDPKISEDVKAKKYNWLYKKRRQLKHELENRPQKVIIDEGKAASAPEVAPYLQESATPKPKLIQAQSSSNAEYPTDSEATSPKIKRKRSTPFKGIISKRYSKDLENYVKDNAEKFRINKNGTFESNVKGRLVKNSNFAEVLDYVQGEIASPPKGFSFLYNRLSKDPLVREMIRETRGESSTEESSGSQSGSGKRRKRSPASYAGINRVYEEARRTYPKIKLKDVYDFLHKQRVYTMHRPARKKFPRLVTRPSGLHTDWQADLAIFDQLAKYNDGNRYLLVCIDVLSRKIFAVPVKTKRSDDMIEAFENIFHLSDGIMPHKLYTDRGLEFEAKKMKEYFKFKDIAKRVVFSPDVHASMAERANRTIKERLYRYFSEKDTLRWVEAIQQIVSGINSSVNRVTENGQVVRISKEKGKFEKGYLPNYTDELFRVHITNDAHTPIRYRLKDLEDNLIEGIFYREELVPTKEDTTHRIAEILKTRTSRTGIKEHFVRWIGYKDIHNNEQESITVFRRYGEKLVSIRIEIPDLSFASEEALEEALNAVLLDTWKKELERERLEEELKREEEENEKRRQELLTVGMVWERKRRAVLSIIEQFDTHGYFDLNTDELNAFIKLYTENNAAVGPEVMHLGRELAEVSGKNIRVTPPSYQKELYKELINKFIISQRSQLSLSEQLIKNGYFDMPKEASYNFIKFLGKGGIILPPISPASNALDGIERVRFHPRIEHKERLKQAIEEFINLPNPKQQETFDSKEESEAITKTEETTSIQQEGAQLPDVSLVTDSSIEMVRLKPQSDQKDLFISAIKNFLAQEEETVETSPPTKTVIQNELSPKEETSQPVASPPSTKTVKQNDVPKQTKAAPETSDSQAESQKTETKETKRQEVVPVFSFDVVSRQLKKDGNFDMPKDLAYKFIKYLNNKIKGAQLPDVSLVTDSSIEMVRLKPQSDQKDLFISAIKNFLAQEEETAEAAPPSNDRAPVKHTDFPKETSQPKAPPPSTKTVPTPVKQTNVPELPEETSRPKAPPPSTKTDPVKQNELPPKEENSQPEAPSPPKSDPVKQNEKLPSPPKDIPKATTPETKITDQETEEVNPAVPQVTIRIENLVSLNEKVTHTSEAPYKASSPSESPTTIPTPELEKEPNAQTEAPTISVSKEKIIETHSNDKTPLDGKITPLSHVHEIIEKPILTDEQKILLDKAVRAATRAWKDSVELADKTQENMEQADELWKKARFKFALKDMIITLKGSGETVHLRKTPENILEWVKAQLILLTNRKVLIDDWTLECLNYGKKSSEAQLEVKAAEARGDVQEARRAADRAKNAFTKVEEAAKQVEKSFQGQKELALQIINRVDEELSKQDADEKSAPVSVNKIHKEHVLPTINEEEGDEYWTADLKFPI
uniref:Integrase catalytic domain-containing protein n=1 Tax=Meloidogyne hapla TaxID=6305 RepID=A0A1I8BGD2_MELHA